MFSPGDYISQRALGIDASGIRKVFDLAAKMKDPINLSIGQPDFDVPVEARAATIDAIQGRKNAYTPTQGIASLRQRLRDDLSREFARDVGDVLITSGVSGALLLAILATIDPGDEAIFLDPYFVMYKHLITMAGGKSVLVDSYPDFRFPAEKVEKAITPKTKLLILSSPSNPTGIVMSEAEVQAAAQIARKHNLLIISDEIYEQFLYDQQPVSAGNFYDGTLVLRGFSKSHAMTGWRLGYAFGPEAIVAQMAKLQQYTFVCAPSPFQLGALAAVDIHMDEHVSAYRRKRDFVCQKLEGKYQISRPGGAFYVFPAAPNGMSGTELVRRAIEKNLLIIPGNVFSERDTHFRISYAASDEKLAAGCNVLLELAR